MNSILPLLCLTAGVFQPHQDSSSTEKRSVTKIAEGVYSIRHPDAPNLFPQGNTTVFIGDKKVLVVDSCYLPSSAEEDLREIRSLTKKPVRYLVNTHWHYDHTMGNGVYAAALPNLKIIAHPETQKRIAAYNAGYIERMPALIDRYKKRAASGKDEQGNALSLEDKDQAVKVSSGGAQVLAEYRTLVDKVPNLTVDKEMRIDLGGRIVKVMFLGKGNTSGDLVVYLPKEKILVAGDLIDTPVPYLGGGFPVDQVKTLERIAEMNVETIVPGHGNVLKGKSYLRMLIQFLDEVVTATFEEIARRGNNAALEAEVADAVRKKVDMVAWRKRFCGENKEDGEFFDSFSAPGLLRAAFRQLVGA